MSLNQKNKITELAISCGETRSSYMVQRAYEYYPRQRLSPKERELLKPLFDVRRDIVNISNVLNSLSEKERNAMLHNFKFLLEWIGYVNTAAERIMDYLNKVQKPNSTPGKTANKNNGNVESNE